MNFSNPRQRDYDHYITGLMLPSNVRPGYFALRAWNIEIASIKDQTFRSSSGLTGKIRMQYWRDQIDAMYTPTSTDGGSRHFSHPVAQALHETIQDHDLTRRFLDTVIDARDEDLDSNLAPDSLDELEQYAERTSSSMLYLVLECLLQQSQRDRCTSTTEEEAAFVAAKHAGICMGLLAIVRGTVYHAEQGKVYLPQTSANMILDQFELQQESTVATTTVHPELSRTIEALVDRAKGHYQLAQDVSLDIPQALVPAFLPLCATKAFLQRLEADSDEPALAVLNPQVIQDSPQSKLRLQWQVLIQRYWTRRF